MQSIDMCRCTARAAETCLLETMIVGGGDRTAALVPLADVAQFYAEHRALDGVHAGVPANLVVIVAASGTVIAQPLHVLAYLRGGCRGGTCVAKCAQVLGGIKAEGGSAAKGSGVAA